MAPKTLLIFRTYLALLLSLISVKTQAQTQVGNTINGEAFNDRSGYSISMPNPTTIAVGALLNDGGGSSSGHVRIFNLRNGKWVQKGNDLDGRRAGDYFGETLSMPDSNTIAIGARNHSPSSSRNRAGQVIVYKWSSRYSKWQIKGGFINGHNATDYLGAVSMPDSNTLAVGAFYNDDNGTNSGHVRIYKWNGFRWVQRGQDIEGEAAGDRSGRAISMPDSLTIAIGATHNDGNGSNSGHVRIYRWNGKKWLQKGDEIDGEAKGDEFGNSVVMSDSNTLAAGSYVNNNRTGHTRVFTWNGKKWTQKGKDIDGESTGDQSGWSLSMPNANTIAIGARYHGSSGSTAPAPGQARIFEWHDTTWVQKGNEIEGDAAANEAGAAVAMPTPNRVAVGEIMADGTATKSGQVRVFDICTPTTTDFKLSTCKKAFKLPSGTKTVYTNGIYYDTLTTKANCDSLLKIDLRFLQSSNNTINVTACSTYTSPSGKYTYTESGTYTDTIVNVLGCDSIITIHFSITRSYDTIDVRSCENEYMVPSGKKTLYNSGIYNDTLKNKAGCDSIITINLAFIETSYDTINTNSCSGFKAPSGRVFYQSGTYIDTISNKAGCDSIITINLSVPKSYDTLNISTCSPIYIAPSGKIYFENGSYFDTIKNRAGCDSIITINLEMNNADTAILRVDESLIAVATSATFQWLECTGIDYITIPDATDRKFTPKQSGNYAVEVEQDNCTDTSNCYAFTIVGSNHNSRIQPSVHPNPSSGQVLLKWPTELGKAHLSLRNVHGQEVEHFSISNVFNEIDLPQMKGWYFLSIETENGLRFMLKVMRL